MRNDFISKGYENTKLITYKDLNEKDYNMYYYDELKDKIIPGVLKANICRDGRLIQLYSEKENHVGVIAATRQGKTTQYIIPTIISFAKQKAKKSMIISDPKGELYRLTSKTVKEEGYRVFLINFRDCLHSEYWNPLTPIYLKYKEADLLDSELNSIIDMEPSKVKFRGIKYGSISELKKAVQQMKEMIMDETDVMIANFSFMVIPDNPKAKEPYWDNAARNWLQAHLWAMLENDKYKEFGSDSVNENTYSMNNLIKIASKIGDSDNASYYFRRRSDDSKSRLFAEPILTNGQVTKKCVVSIFYTAINMFCLSSIRTITSANSLDLKKVLIDESTPLAIYISYPDEIKTTYSLIGLFIRQCYTILIEYANGKRHGKFDNPFYFILDEFGNFPEIPDFDVVISACGGRNIFFILVLQSYAQLENVYDNKTAEIIKDNLNVHVFLGSNNSKTIESFCDECGMYTRISPISIYNGKEENITNYQSETIPLIPRSTLRNFNLGECIITEINCRYVLWTMLERYYLVKEMNKLEESDYKDYCVNVNPFSSKYNYSIDIDEWDDF